MTPHQQQDPADILYICSLEDLNCLHDYFMAAVNGEDLAAVPRLWNQQMGIIRSRKAPTPAAPEEIVRIQKILLENRPEIIERLSAPFSKEVIEEMRKIVRKHDTTIRKDECNQTLDAIQNHTEGRLKGLELIMVKPAKDRCESAQDKYLKEAHFELTLVKQLIESLRTKEQK